MAAIRNGRTALPADVQETVRPRGPGYVRPPAEQRSSRAQAIVASGLKWANHSLAAHGTATPLVGAMTAVAGPADAIGRQVTVRLTGRETAELLGSIPASVMDQEDLKALLRIDTLLRNLDAAAEQERGGDADE